MRKMHDASLCFLTFSYAGQLAKQKSSGVDQGSGLLSQRTETFPIRANTAHPGSIPRLSGAGEVNKKNKTEKSGVIFLRMSLRIGMLFVLLLFFSYYELEASLGFGTWRVTKLDTQLGIDKRLRSRFGLQTLQTKRDRAATIARIYANPKQEIGR